jgi:hypothetical protein
MSKFKFAVLISAVCLMGVIFHGLVGFSQLPSGVQLTTEPPLSQVLPFEAEAFTPLGSNKLPSPVRLTLQALDAKSQPLENAKIHLQIFTPAKNLLFTTDFPIVEGTKLLDLEAIAPTGELQIQQMLPIRGRYKLLVNVTPIIANQFSPLQQTLTLDIPENSAKYRNFGILAATLLFVGIVGGLIMGGQQVFQAEEIAPLRVRLLLSGAVVVAIATLLVVNISAEMAESHTHESLPHEHQLQTKNSAVVTSGLKLQLTGDRHATVGQVANLQVQAIDTKTNQPATDVVFSIKTTQLEDNWVAFAYQGIPDPTGKLTWQQQFFDGAPHKLEVEVSPQLNKAAQFQPFQASQEIEVEGVAPPLVVRLISLTYFTSIVVLGLALGLWLRRRSWA